MMEYKGYLGKIEFDDEANSFHGEVVNIRDVVTFAGQSVDELRQAFEDSIGDYLEFCAERMDRIIEYRELIKKLLTRYAELINLRPKPDQETEVIFDEERDHYMLITTGWANQRRVRGTTVYVRLRGGKFWIEEDWLENGIATDLLEAGVPKDDIVLAFHPPQMRPLTEFATA